MQLNQDDVRIALIAAPLSRLHVYLPIMSLALVAMGVVSAAQLTPNDSFYGSVMWVAEDITQIFTACVGTVMAIEGGIMVTMKQIIDRQRQLGREQGYDQGMADGRQKGKVEGQRDRDDQIQNWYRDLSEKFKEMGLPEPPPLPELPPPEGGNGTGTEGEDAGS